jgi:VNT family MFS transporter (synaptic vesicle glycoprotein 2)
MVGTLTPINGMLVLNQESWNLYIPFLDLNYRAWRIFILVCAVPSIISAIIMMIFIPESPKFTYSQGDESRTMAILQRIYRCNTGKSSNEFKVKSLIKDKEFEEATKPHSGGFFKFMWSQTVPLFKRPHLKNTLTACFLQFGLCVSANSYFTFYPEILNKVFLWLESDPTHITATVCKIYSSFESNSTAIDEIPTSCPTRLEINVFLNVIMLMLMYGFGWFIMSLIINKTGKLAILVFISFSSGGASLLMMFIELPKVAIYVYVLVLLASLNMSLVNSSTVELFPTNLR